MLFAFQKLSHQSAVCRTGMLSGLCFKPAVKNPAGTHTVSGCETFRCRPTQQAGVASHDILGKHKEE